MIEVNQRPLVHDCEFFFLVLQTIVFIMRLVVID